MHVYLWLVTVTSRVECCIVFGDSVVDSDVPTSMRITSSGPAARLLPPHPNDVVCVPKRYATDQTASQQPVLVLPQSFLNRLQSVSPSISRPARPTHADRRATWLELADSLLRQHPESVQVARSIRYLIRIGKGEIPAPVFFFLSWLESDKPEIFLDGLHTCSTASLLLPVATLKARLRNVR